MEEEEEEDLSRDAERSIDELLASLGGFDEPESNTKASGKSMDVDAEISEMVESLQDWRAKNQEQPFAEWDEETKAEFNVS